MASIGSLSSAYRTAYYPDQGTQVSSVRNSAQNTAVSEGKPGDREQRLTQQLDTQLAEKLRQIRQQIGSAGNNPAASGLDGIRRTLDIHA